MSMVGTFDGFTAARLGIYAAQHGLRVTGNNVSNINTPGYTRQRVDQLSFKAGANDMYRSLYDNHVGSGALVTGINQVRDPYLDIRYRNASTDTYHYDTWLAGLQNIASILDEVGKGENKDGLIYKAIQDLAEKLRSYSANPTSLNDRLVRNSAASLTLLFHNAAGRLEKLYNETVNEFNEDVSAVNQILTNIRDLNKSIRESEIHGDHALEMRDERNRQIDALSQYLDIKVEYSYESVGGGIEVEKLTIKLNDANPDPSVKSDESILVDGVFATQLSVPDERPVLNTFGEDYPYLKNYTYLKKISAEQAQEIVDALNEGKDPDDEGYIKSLDDFLPSVTETDADGNEVTYYLVGTNDPDVKGLYTEANDNFSIHLGKLLNVKGEEWKSSTTAWLEVTPAEAASKAIFSYSASVDLDTLKALATGDQKISINGKDVDLSSCKDETEVLETIANAINNDPGAYPGYIVTVSEDGANLIFTPDPDNLPTSPINLSFKPGQPDWLTIGSRESIPAQTFDEHGNVTKSVSYVQSGGKWYELTISTAYTHEITLDDNDLHGILQAEREMLTEEGEFSSEKDVALDESALIKRGIPYYIKSLDLLAQKFAEAYNQLNTGYAYNQDGYYIDKEGNVLTIDDLNDLDGDGYVSIDGLTAGQAQNLINNGYFMLNDLGQPIDKNGNVITYANGEPLGYFRADDAGYAIDKNGERILDDDGEPIPASKLTFDPTTGDPQIVTTDPTDGTVTTITLDSERFSQFEADLNSWLDEFGYSMGGEMFTQLDGTTTEGITAKNISVSHGWSNGLWNLIPTFKMLFTDSGGLTHSTQNDNADHMVAMIDKGLTYNPRDLYGSDAIGPELFTGSFNDMLSNMMAVEGEDASITQVRLTTYATALNELDYSREGVSGVDLNDEAMNMVQYQKAMTAAMRVMTAIDEVLDRLINNTGIAGR